MKMRFILSEINSFFDQRYSCPYLHLYVIDVKMIFKSLTNILHVCHLKGPKRAQKDCLKPVWVKTKVHQPSGKECLEILIIIFALSPYHNALRHQTVLSYVIHNVWISAVNWKTYCMQVDVAHEKKLSNIDSKVIHNEMTLKQKTKNATGIMVKPLIGLYTLIL